VKRLVIGALMYGLATASWAQGRPPTLKLTPALNTPQAQELIRHFERLCLDKFPNDDAVAQSLREMGAVAMPAGLVGNVLGGAGQGWQFQGETGSFVVTLKAVPDRHCAVRTVGETLLAPDWRPFLRKAAGARKRELSGDIDYDQPQAGGGISHVFVNMVLTAAPPENYTLIVEEHPERAQHRVDTRVMRRIMSLPPQR
jgi:hypothetical protein